TSRAQQAGRMRRVGILVPYPKGDAEYESRVHALRQEIAKLGWTEGSNIQFDERWTTDDMSRVWAEAASLMASNPDVIVANGGRVVPVLMQLSRSIPIVVPGVSGPSASVGCKASRGPAATSPALRTWNSRYSARCSKH